MGGRLALGIGVTHPERVSALILESATAGIPDEHERHQRAEADQELARRIEEAGVETFVGEWSGSRSGRANASSRTRFCACSAHPPAQRAVGLANSLRGMGQGAQPSYWDRLGDIAVPVLLIAGGLDRKFVGIAGQMGVRIADATTLGGSRSRARRSHRAP